MKKILFISAIIASIIIILLSRASYQDKLNSISSNAVTTSLEAVNKEEEADPPTDTEQAPSNTNTSGLIGEWINEHPDSDELHITYFGSLSLLNEDDEAENWPQLVTDTLNDQFPSIEIQSSVIEAGRLTTDTILEDNYVEEVIETNPDLLIFEPFILNNNGNIFIDDTLEMTSDILTTFEEAIPDVTIIFVSSNPLYNTVNYESQNNTFKTFVKDNGYLYADHWEAWPSTDDEELTNYLNEGRPNTSGHEVWADYMIEYLTTY